jgi:hypothetical protein
MKTVTTLARRESSKRLISGLAKRVDISTEAGLGSLLRLLGTVLRWPTKPETLP